MPESLINLVQFEAARKFFLDRAYELLSVDRGYRLYCHIPGKLVSLSFREIYYSSEFNIPRLGEKRESVYFNEHGIIISAPDPLPAVVAEIPLNSGSGTESDKALTQKMLIPAFMSGDD